MKQKIRITGKILLICVFTFLLIIMISRDSKKVPWKQPEGTPVRIQKMIPMIDKILYVRPEIADTEEWKRYSELLTEKNEEAVLTYGIYNEMIDILNNSPFSQQAEEQKGAAFRQRQLAFDSKYRDEYYMTEEDWYSSYDRMLEFYELTDKIRLEKMTILCSDREVINNTPGTNHYLLTSTGEIYTATEEMTQKTAFSVVQAYVYKNEIVTVRKVTDEIQTISNVFIQQSGTEDIHFFYHNYEFICPPPGNQFLLEENRTEEQAGWREQIGSITFGGGRLHSIETADEKISGKLLAISDNYLEIEEAGRLEMAPDCTGYRIYEAVKTATPKELTIGFDYYDFFIKDGMICGFLITQNEVMEKIRIAIMNKNFDSLYHDKLVIVCSEDALLSYGSYENRKMKRIEAGETVSFEKGSEYLSGERAGLHSITNTGRLTVTSLHRAQGMPEYRGSLEILDTENGLVLMNELLLEEYLYSVVPSEMPASYPPEALKAQAVCARTYAYRYYHHPGYPELGAHMDDSVGYQVYNNIAENPGTTGAVRETAGVLLTYQEKPAETYYYSTSCGYGTDAGIWSKDRINSIPYLSAHAVQKDTEDALQQSAEAMQDEDSFRLYISNTNQNAFESAEPWFRWRYEVTKLDMEMLNTCLMKRYEANPELILTYVGRKGRAETENSFESRKPGKIRSVSDIVCIKRRPGGAAEELLLVTDKGTYKIISEYNIRAVLNQGGTVWRSDETGSAPGALLPSAYLVINIVKSQENVIGYTIIGGGYGHGVGMSQNGAKAMALENYTAEEILSFFYRGCILQKIY